MKQVNLIFSKIIQGAFIAFVVWTTASTLKTIILEQGFVFYCIVFAVLGFICWMADREG